MATLDLPRAERVSVFRALVQILRADPIVSRVCPVILAWEGKPTDASPLTTGMASQGAAMRMTPVGMPDQWLDPSGWIGDLIINFEILIRGYDADDMLNFWKAVQAAIYAPTNTTFPAIQAILRNAGAFPPSPESANPAFDVTPESNYQFATAQMRIKVRTALGSRGS